MVLFPFLTIRKSWLNSKNSYVVHHLNSENMKTAICFLKSTIYLLLLYFELFGYYLFLFQAFCRITWKFVPLS